MFDTSEKAAAIGFDAAPEVSILPSTFPSVSLEISVFLGSLVGT